MSELEKSVQFCGNFLKGYNDCKEGKPHEHHSAAHSRGYSTRYEEEAIEEKQSQRGRGYDNYRAAKAAI